MKWCIALSTLGFYWIVNHCTHTQHSGVFQCALAQFDRQTVKATAGAQFQDCASLKSSVVASPLSSRVKSLPENSLYLQCTQMYPYGTLAMQDMPSHQAPCSMALVRMF